MSRLNSLWIDVHKNSNNVFLYEHQHSLSAFHQLRYPNEQDPQMIMLIGDKSKARAIQAIDSSPTHDSGHKGVHLRLLNRSKTRSPVLIADCALHNADVVTPEALIPGADQHLLLWHRNAPPGLDGKILAHLVY